MQYLPFDEDKNLPTHQRFNLFSLRQQNKRAKNEQEKRNEIRKEPVVCVPIHTVHTHTNTRTYIHIDVHILYSRRQRQRRDFTLAHIEIRAKCQPRIRIVFNRLQLHGI